MTRAESGVSGGYRDDRSAQKARIAELEAQLDKARSENEALRATEHAKREPAENGRTALGCGGLGLLVVAAGAFLGIPILIVGGVVLVAIAIPMGLLVSFMHVVPPNRVLVLSGRRRTLSGGATVGWRALRGGRALRIPFLERADYLDTSNIVVPLEQVRLFTKDAKEAHVTATANVKIDAYEPRLQNAVERFLGLPQKQIADAAQQVLEGCVREVFAVLPVDVIRSDPDRVNASILDEAEHDFDKLGLVLDSFKVLDVQVTET